MTKTERIIAILSDPATANETTANIARMVDVHFSTAALVRKKFMSSNGSGHKSNGLPVPIADPHQIVLVSQAKQFLAEARSIDEVKEIRDKAEAMRLYLRQRDESLEAQNTAAEIKLWAERRAGEMLVQMKKSGELATQGGDRKSKSNDSILKLKDLGVDLDQASQWQRVAEVPEPEFEEHLEETKAANIPLTTRGVLRKVKETRQTKKVQTDGVPALVDQVQNQEVSVSAAAQVSTLPKPDQEIIVSKGPGAVELAGEIIRRSKAAEKVVSLTEEEKYEKNSEAWSKFYGEFYILLSSIDRRGGIETLAKHWPVSGVQQAIINLENFRSILDEYIVKLRGLLP